MAEPSDPFQPQQGPDLQGVAQEWTDALNDPKVKASLLSFGLQAMQPLGFGQTTAGGLGQAIGAAGEGIGRQEEMDRRQQESDAKTTMASARSLAEEARAGDAKSKAENAKANLDLKERSLELKRGMEYNRQLTTLIRDHSALVKAHTIREDKEAFMTPGYVRKPAPTLEQYAAQRGALHILQGSQSYGAPDGGAGAPAAAGGGAQAPVADFQTEMAEAQRAINRGVPREAVAQRFRERTGQEMP